MAALPRRRVYGSHHDGPDDQPGHEYVELVGALDGQLVGVTHWTPTERTTGAMLITNDGMYGAGGRAGEPSQWGWVGDTVLSPLRPRGGPAVGPRWARPRPAVGPSPARGLAFRRWRH
ncbi:hypothetical protein [Streptomyces sp. NPDC053720]|uniref:hypothetical protein n=1 Tax=Streptomyces sp. NPDC053720 TaxID=3154855 RepID=UPI003436A1D2